MTIGFKQDAEGNSKATTTVAFGDKTRLRKIHKIQRNPAAIGEAPIVLRTNEQLADDRATRILAAKNTAAASTTFKSKGSSLGG